MTVLNKAPQNTRLECARVEVWGVLCDVTYYEVGAYAPATDTDDEIFPAVRVISVSPVGDVNAWVSDGSIPGEDAFAEAVEAELACDPLPAGYSPNFRVRQAGEL